MLDYYLECKECGCSYLFNNPDKVTYYRKANRTWRRVFVSWFDDVVMGEKMMLDGKDVLKGSFTCTACKGMRELLRSY